MTWQWMYVTVSVCAQAACCSQYWSCGCAESHTQTVQPLADSTFIACACCTNHFSGHIELALMSVMQAHNNELAGPLTVSASYARSQNAATPQPSSLGSKTSKVATFTSATLSKAATLKNKVLAPSAASAPVMQPGQESLPANRGKPVLSVAWPLAKTCLVSCAFDVVGHATGTSESLISAVLLFPIMLDSLEHL